MKATAPPDLLFSLAEVNALLTKAARGAGFSWGEAEEAGWAALWLTREGLEGAELLLSVLQSPGLSAPRLSPFLWTSEASALCPLRTGLTLVDCAELHIGLQSLPLTLEHVACPGVLLPFVSRAARQLEQPLQLQTDTFSCRFLADGRLASSLPPPELPRPAQVTLVLAPEDSLPLLASSQTFAAPLRKDVWQGLEALARLTSVPASRQSQARAGARGSDND